MTKVRVLIELTPASYSHDDGLHEYPLQDVVSDVAGLLERDADLDHVVAGSAVILSAKVVKE